MRMSVGQKALRVVLFLLGVRNREIARTMRKYGFTEEHLAEGWALLRELTRGRLDVRPARDPRPIRELDGWENHWFPIVSLVLGHHFPEVHEQVFRNVGQTSGPEVVFSVAMLVDRLEALPKPETEGGMGEIGAKARALLAERGLTAEELGVAKSLLAKVGTPEDDDHEPLPAEANDQAERALWSWYLEWSGIARHAIKDRKLLRAMGFLQGPKGSPESPAEPGDPEPAPTPEPQPAG